MYMSLYMLSPFLPTTMPADHLPTASVIPLTQARVRLFQIVDAVLSGETPRVVLSHRDRDGDVVLMAAAELQKLEQDLAALRAQAGVGPLRGLVTLHAPLEQVIDKVRARQRVLATKKVSGLSGEADAERREQPALAAEPRPRGYRARRPRA